MNYIKAQDLMIGDWVLFPEGIGQVVHIGIEFIIARVDEYECMRQVSEIKPIPLTAEILEKNGFVISLDIALFDRSTGQIKDDFVCAARLEFVHELQHALRLCGIEKEIVL